MLSVYRIEQNEIIMKPKIRNDRGYNTLLKNANFLAAHNPKQRSFVVLGYVDVLTT